MALGLYELINNINKQIKAICCKIDSQGGGSQPAYKVYRALLTQSGYNDPTAIVLENTIGSITYRYTSVGNYWIESPFLFTLNKTYVQIGNGSNSNGNASAVVTTLWDNDSTIIINTWGNSLDQYVDGYLRSTSIEIIVYP